MVSYLNTPPKGEKNKIAIQDSYTSKSEYKGEFAKWYASSIEEFGGPHSVVIPAMICLLPCRLYGLQIADIGCGSGILSRELALRGAEVLGVDLSEDMLELARQAEERIHLGIVYQQDDACVLSSVTDHSQDAVTMCLSLTDMPNIEAVFSQISRILKFGGCLIASLPHPCAPCSSHIGLDYPQHSYYEEIRWMSSNRQSVRGRIPTYHRPLSLYINLALQHGLVLERMLEPQPSPLLLARYPQYERVPYMLVLRFRLQCFRPQENETWQK